MKYSSLVKTDDLFLTADNPTATSDQRELEAMALRSMATETVARAKEAVAMRWRILAGDPITEEMEIRFDELVEEYLFLYVLMATNSDPNYPKVLGHIYGPPHEWFGRKVPGSRGSGGDSPDNHYSLVPIDHLARYELDCQCFGDGPGDVPFTLTGNLSLSMTLNSLDWQNVKIDRDGKFKITIDPYPANGRPNHLQTQPAVKYLFIRDCRSDWRQKPNSYRITRLDPPVAAPFTEEQIAALGARFAVDNVPAMFWFMRTFDRLEPNMLHEPFATGEIGGLVSQMISFARLELGDDDALVVTIGGAGAPFRNLVLMDAWFRTFDYWNNTSTMNNAQAIPNADGSTTYVISQQDPGVHNWLDPVGFKKLLVVHRWQGLKQNSEHGVPWVKSHFLKIGEIEPYLPAEMKRVTSEERHRQIQQRQEQFKLRYVDV